MDRNRLRLAFMKGLDLLGYAVTIRTREGEKRKYKSGYQGRKARKEREAAAAQAATTA